MTQTATKLDLAFTAPQAILRTVVGKGHGDQVAVRVTERYS